MTNLEKLSLAELKAINEESAKLLSKLVSEKREIALKQIQEICTESGISVADLKAFVKGYGKPAPNPENIKTYVNPANQEKWTDDGATRKPKWIRDHVKAGKPLDELLAAA